MSLGFIAVLFAAGVAVGFFSALFGVGGGILMVPLMVLVLDKSQHLAEGTSLLVIVPAAIVGVLAQRKTNRVSFRHAGLMALGGTLGALFGGLLALKLPSETLQWFFGVVLALTGLRVIHAGFFQWRPRGRVKARATGEEQPAPR